MRINLVTPFAEKDAVKALGARWDSAQKTWYISDVADLTPFARWIPHLKASAGKVAATPPTSKASTSHTPPGGPAVARPTVGLAHCGCLVLPWEDCPHTVNP
jgi:hypothetical protein